MKKQRVRPTLPHPTDPSLALVELTKGYYATISIVDAIEVGASNWCVVLRDGRAYASGRSHASLHRFIGRLMGLSLEHEVDHINGNGLDCRRSNLRDATTAQNQHNRRLQKNNKSGIKGVSWDSQGHGWVARVRKNRRVYNLGVFKEIAAARAEIMAKRLELHGEFANHGVN